jgi:hypothetical protein
MGWSISDETNGLTKYHLYSIRDQRTVHLFLTLLSKDQH